MPDDPPHRRTIAQVTGPAMTLGDLHGMGLSAVELWCHRCHGHALLDAGPMRAVLGDDAPVPDIWRACICTRCGETRHLETRPAWAAVSPGVVTRHG